MSHFYNEHGELVTEVEGSRGKMVKPDSRHIKKHNLIPSVTTILKQINKPSVNTYLMRETAKACMELPYDTWAEELSRDEGILYPNDEDYIKEVMRMANIPGQEAADFGTRMHHYIDMYLKGGMIVENFPLEEDREIFLEVVEYFEENNIKGKSEETLVFEIEGMKTAGTNDNNDNEQSVVRDWKTQKTKDGKFNKYPEWVIQLGGYNTHLGMDRGEIIAISSNEPGVIKTFKYSAKDLKIGAMQFRNHLHNYYLSKGLITI